MEFFGTYLEVTPHSRLVWTNEEGDQGKTVTTVTFDEVGGKTLLVVHDLYASKEAREAGSGSTEAMPEAFDQLDEPLADLVSSTEAHWRNSSINQGREIASAQYETDWGLAMTAPGFSPQSRT